MHLINLIEISTLNFLTKRLIKRFFFEAKRWSSLWLWVPLSVPSPRLLRFKSYASAVGFPLQSGLGFKVRSAVKPSYLKTINKAFVILAASFLFTTQNTIQAQNCPTADFEFSNTCLSQYTQFTSTSINVETGATYQWDFDNDQSYDLETTRSTVHWEFPTIGIYTVSLNITANDSCTTNSKKYFLEIVECEDCVVKSIVPNNSFEYLTYCPTNGAITATENWFSANGGSPHLIEDCSGFQETDTIKNKYGTQAASTGKIYAGIIAYHENESREYLGVELKEPLKAGNLYCISYKVSLAETSVFAIAELGAYFSTNQIIDPANMNRLNSIPQFENKNILTDTENWTTINSNFIADKDYKFLTLGNFSENTTTLAVTATENNPYHYIGNQAYYFIDDVVVTPFIANVEPGTEICPGEKVNLTAESEGLCETFWTTTENPGLILSNKQKFEVVPTETTSYIFNAKNECCLFQDTITINIKDVITAHAGQDVEVCEGEATTLSVAGNIDFNWSPQAGIVNPNSATTEVIPFETTTYTLMVTNQNGCQSFDEIVVTVIDKPKVEITSTVAFYPGEPVQLHAISNENNQYQWLPSRGLSNSNIPDPTAAPESTTLYTVNVTNENNCTTVAYTTVEVKECQGYANAGNDRSICEGDAIPLKASGGIKYVWTPTDGLDSPDVFNPIARPAKTTSYNVAVTNLAGCTFKDEITINVEPKPQLSVMETVNLCAGETATLTATGSGQFYNWKPSTGLSDTSISNPVFTGNTATTYTVSNFNSEEDKCIASAKIKVSVLDTASINISDDSTICIGETAQLTASGGTNYSWSPTTGLSDPSIANPVASPTATTTYTVEISNEACSFTKAVIITVTESSKVNAGEDATICDGESYQLNATGGIDYLWFPSEGLSDPTIANPIASPTETTTYQLLSGGNNSSCSSTDEITVAVKPSDTITITGEQNICAGDLVQLMASGGATYLWSPAESLDNTVTANPIAMPLETTTYEVTTLNENGQCESKASITITVNEAATNSSISVDAGEDFTICGGQDVQLFATSTGTKFTWIPAAGLSNPNIANPVANIDTTTVYTVLVSNGDNEEECPARDSVIIKVEEGVDLVLDEGPLEICKGASIQLSASGASKYSWSPVESLNDPTIPNPIATPLENTVYVLSASNARGSCKTVVDVAVNILDLNAPEISITEDQAICLNGQVQLSATGGTTYLWSPEEGLNDPTIPNPVATPSESINYEVTVSNNEGKCSSIANVFIEVSETAASTILANAGDDITVCKGENIQLIATGGTTYIWSPIEGLDNPFIANPMASVDETTTYTVTVSSGDEGDCPAMDSITITVKDGFDFNFNEDPIEICSGEAVQLTAAGADNYSWSPQTGLDDPQSASPIATPSTSVTYVLTASNDAGCEAVKNVTLTVKQPGQIETSSDQNICEGDSVQIMVMGGSAYSWLPVQGLSDSKIAAPVAFPTETTSYEITVTDDATNCPAKANVIIGVLPKIEIELNSTDTICLGSSTKLTVSGATNLSYVWTPAMNLDNATIQNPVANPKASTVYTVTASYMDMMTCRSSKSIELIVEEMVEANAGLDQVICSGGTAQLEASGGTYYSWSPETGLSNPSIANPIANPSVSTTYAVTISNQNNTCRHTDEITVNVEDGIEANAGEDQVLCSGDSVQLLATGGTKYEWSPADGLNDPNIANPMAEPTSTTTYTVTVSNGNDTACSDTDEITISVEEGINLTFDEGPFDICEGETVHLSALGGGTYKWTPVNTLSDPNVGNPMATPLETTTYQLVATNLRGTCAVIKEATVNVQSKIELASNPEHTICSGEVVQLNVTGASEYSWIPETALSNITVGNPMANPENTTTYMVTGTTGLCSASTEIEVMVEAAPELQIIEDQTICSGSSVQLNVSGGENYSWWPTDGLDNPNIANPVATPGTSTTYRVTSSNGNCNTSETVTVFVDNATIPRLCTQPVVTKTICPEDFCTINENEYFEEVDNTYFFCSIGITDSGCIEYTALPMFFGIDTITITACNNLDNEVCQTLTAIMSVEEDCESEDCSNPIQQLPCVNPQQLIEVCPEFCLFNQLEGTGISEYAILDVDYSSQGTVELNDKCFNYTPAAGFMGPDVINVTACSTIYPDYCDEITYVIDVLEDCGYGQKPGIYHTQNSKPKSESSINKIDEFVLPVLKVFPLPASNFINVELAVAKFEDKTGVLQISNLNGEVILQEQIMLEDGLQKHHISIENLAKGLYFLSFQNNDIFITEKFIKD